MNSRIIYFIRRAIPFLAAVTAVVLFYCNTIAGDMKIKRRIDNNYGGLLPARSEEISVLININTASPNRLQRISGIGETKAAAISEYRERFGEFQTVEDLINVNGIGEKTLEQIRGQITTGR